MAFHKLGDVLGQRRDAGGIGRQRVVAEHVAVVLHGRPAAGCVDDDRVQGIAAVLGHPGTNVGRGRGMAEILFAHMMGQGPATAHPICDDHVTAMARQQPDGGRVDVVVERALRTAGHQGDAGAARALGPVDLRVVMTGRRGDARRGDIKHCAQLARDQAAERLCQLGPCQCQTEPPGIGQDHRQH